MLSYLFWSHSPLAYEVIMDGEKEKSYGNGSYGAVLCSTLNFKRWELEESQRLLRKY